MSEVINIKELNERIERESVFVDTLRTEMGKVIIGQSHLVDTLLIGLLSNGHILLEGVPGLAKTLAITTLAKAVDAAFSRIQFTPDLLPADLIGTLIYTQKNEEFVVKKGPVFANFVLADEINRSPAKVQSALLEAMQERQVTIGDNTYPLPQPFLVLATQNPLEQEGTYPLPEAQVDRFMLKAKISYPKKQEERDIVRMNLAGGGLPAVNKVISPEDIVKARKVVEDVAMIRGLSLARNEKSLYDFGLEIATRSGIIAAYRTENTPEATSALDNIEELLNSMQLFKEQRDAEIRSGERREDEEATIDEWLQNVMLMTDMDKDDPEDRNKVTLMTVHSAKGLEYKYVYIVGLEENLFPSQRAAESPDGIEEERRLFYVALTRAKVEATISYAEMRFKWGNMEFSRPSCFLREIDPKYVRADFDAGEERPRRPQDGEGPSAIDELRRRFDYRFQQKRQADRAGGNNGGNNGGQQGGFGGQQGGFGGRGSGGSFGGRSADDQSGPARRFARAAAPQGARPAGRPDPALVQTPRLSTDGMRRVGVRQAVDGGVPVGPSMPVSGDYTVGQRVEHPKFGVGIVQRIETLATDHKLVVAFDSVGEKTLLAKFAKLTKL